MVFLGINLHWYFQIRRAQAHEASTRKNRVKEGTNWYNYIYGSADILPEPVVHVKQEC